MSRTLFQDREFYQKLSALMIPMALQNLMLAAVSAGDSAMLGFVDQNAMAAVSQAANVQFVENLFLGGIVTGTMILTAQYWGKKDTDMVERIFGLSLRYGLLISVLFFLAALAFPRQLMSLFTNDGTLLEIGTDYIKVAALSYLLAGINRCYLSVMQTTGQTEESAAISAFALGLDTVLNAVFIFGLHMGAMGAALTTSISRLVELGILLVFSKKMAVFPSIRHVEREVHQDFLKCSIPAMVNSMFWGLGSTLYSVIIGHLGAAMTAAYSVASLVRQLAFAICQGFGSGGQILLANVLGSGDLEKGKTYGGQLFRLSGLCGIVCGGLTLLFGAALSQFMTLTPESRSFLGVMIWVCALNILTACVNVVSICGIFAAGGDTAFNAYCAITTMWGIILPLAIAATFWWKWEPLAVYFILCMDELVKLPWVCIHYRKYRWLKDMTQCSGPL